ncbi:MAG: dioxygenase [Candidatus Andersenbacteria bacterium]
MRYIIGGILFLVGLGGLLFLQQQSGVAPLTPNPSTAIPSSGSGTPPTNSNVPISPNETPPHFSSCTGQVTPALTEGPYYKTGSPERTSLRESDIAGERLVISGYVFNKDCQPLPGAWLDFWQADTAGTYDNAGYKLRGHQFTDSSGQYRLETIIPARYSGRTPHIHVKVRPAAGSTLTTQLFFPGEDQNETDAIFNEALIVTTTGNTTPAAAIFNFVLNQ